MANNDPFHGNRGAAAQALSLAYSFWVCCHVRANFWRGHGMRILLFLSGLFYPVPPRISSVFLRF
jgi:hypothetical protein